MNVIGSWIYFITFLSRSDTRVFEMRNWPSCNCAATASPGVIPWCFDVEAVKQMDRSSSTVHGLVGVHNGNKERVQRHKGWLVAREVRGGKGVGEGSEKEDEIN